MHLLSLLRLLPLAALTASVSAAEIVFDFEDLAGNPDLAAADFTSLSYELDGLAMDVRRTTGLPFTVWRIPPFPAPADWGEQSLSPGAAPTADDAFVATFSSYVESVSIEVGDYGRDSDDVILTAFSGEDGGGTILGSVEASWGNGDFRYGDDALTLSIASEPGVVIRSVVFRGGSVSHPNSVFYDNITVVTVCRADLDGTGEVGFGDLIMLLGGWGTCADCAGDLNADQQINFTDLVLLLSEWGDCP